LEFMVHDFLKFNVPKIFATLAYLTGLPRQGGGALLYDISLPKTYRPKLLILVQKVIKIEKLNIMVLQC
jgi:hypothetical protein